MHGTADIVVPYGGSFLFGYVSVEESVGGWVERNRCTGGPRTEQTASDTRCETWDACAAGAEVTLCTIEGGPHEWPGQPGSTADVDATELAWSFLSRFQL